MITKTLSSALSPLVMRVSLSRYVTSNSPLLVSDGGLNASGKRGNSRGGSCDKFPVVFTVVFSNIILIFDDPVLIRRGKKKKALSEQLSLLRQRIL